MRKIKHFILATALISSIVACDDAGEGVYNPGNQNDSSQLSQNEMNNGLKEALKTSTKRAVDTLSQKNGYFKDQAVKIPFPPDAQNVADQLDNIGAGDLVNKLVKKLNRAAEDAADKATPIFLEAIKAINFSDARNILEGSDSAATHYFRNNTKEPLFDTFQPDVENSLEKVGAQSAWNEVTTRYNQIPLVEPIETDLAKYTTEKALDGLFQKLKKEEKLIRENPIARTKAILEKVFSQFEGG